MTTEFIISISIAILTGAMLGFFISRARSSSVQGQQAAVNEQLQIQLNDLTMQQQENAQALSASNERVNTQITDIAVL